MCKRNILQLKVDIFEVQDDVVSLEVGDNVAKLVNALVAKVVGPLARDPLGLKKRSQIYLCLFNVERYNFYILFHRE